MSERASRNQAVRSGETDHSANSPTCLLIVGLVVGIAFVGWKENTYWQTWLARLPSNVLAALAIPPFVSLSLNRGITLSEDFKLVAGVDEFFHHTPIPAVSAVLIFIGVFAFGAVLFRVL